MAPTSSRGRSKSSSSSDRADAHISRSHPVHPLVGSLDNLSDTSFIQGKDVWKLRDNTIEALSNVYDVSQSSARRLVNSIRATNTTLETRINDSFKAVGDRIDALPRVATLVPDGQQSKLTTFSGAENGAQFGVWLRRLEDIIKMKGENDPEKKAYFLIGHLDGVAREKVDELPEADRKVFDTVVTHLRTFFESPQQKYLARQSLSLCKQNPGESAVVFANRILALVQAATTGQTAAAQKKRAL